MNAYPRTAGRIENVEWLLRCGEGTAAILARLDVTADALTRYLDRHGRHDLARRFDRPRRQERPRVCPSCAGPMSRRAKTCFRCYDHRAVWA